MFFADYSDPYASDTGPVGDEVGCRELLEAYLVELDPTLDAFGPVIIELYAIGAGDGWQGFEVRQIATATANRLLVFRTISEELARAVYSGEATVAELAGCAAVSID